MSAHLRILYGLSLAIAAALLICDRCASAAERPAKAKAVKAPSVGEQKGAKSDREAAIRRALSKRLKLKPEHPFMGLQDFCDLFSKAMGVPIQIDKKSLDDVGIGTDTEVVVPTMHVSCRALLERLLDELDLTWVIRNEVLLITTPETAEQLLTVKIYDVSDLAPAQKEAGQAAPAPAASRQGRTKATPPKGGEDGKQAAPVKPEPLIDVITTCVSPTAWDGLGGPGSIVQMPGIGVCTLVVSQTDQVHEKIASLLADLRQLCPGKADRRAPARQAKAADEPHAVIHRALSKQVALDAIETPLLDVVELLEKQVGIPIILDRKGLDEVGIGTDTPITCNKKDVSLESLLGSVLRKHDLSWTIRFESLCITTPEREERSLHVRVHDVSDFAFYRNRKGKPTADYHLLMHMIQNAIDPDSWAVVGGPGDVCPFDQAGIHALVTSQTYRTQRKIEEFLARLREKYKQDIARKQRGELRPLPARRGLTSASANPWAAVARPWDDPTMATPEAPPEPLLPSAQRDAVISGNSRFAVDLYGKLRSDLGKNLLFSPYSISVTVAMAHAGARGDTAAEIARVFHFPAAREELDAGFEALADATHGRYRPRGCELRSANRVWLRPEYPILGRFLQTLQQQHRATVGIADFGKPKVAAATINDWVKLHTAGRISELVSPRMINDDIRLVLANAVYFKRRWQSPFKPGHTETAPFYVDEKTIQVRMMHQKADFPYAELPGLQVLAMPYRGEEMSMVIVLPGKASGALAKVEETLSVGQISRWTSALETREVKLFVPKFTIGWKSSLDEVLQSLGMTRAYSPAKADFSGINGGVEPLWIFWIIHQATIEVDERGTIATAATGGAGGGFALPPPPVPVFRADHPFLFFIRDNRTGNILFMGRLMKPEEVAMGSR